ncbi:melanocortin-2 receptor accessory protein [Pteropus alecto]|nr:melanocortin-2 receptor accessory protein [Pteropus alecto]
MTLQEISQLASVLRGLGAVLDAPPASAADMANRTNASALYYSFEYYLDYLDLIPVDEKKLRANKHSIVIIFWVSLAVFVVLLFLVLLYMSWSGSPQVRNNVQHHPACPWSFCLDLPLCIRRHLLHHRTPRGTLQAPPSSAKEPGSMASGPNQQRQQGSPSAAPPAAPRPTLLSFGNWPLMGTPVADVGNKTSEPPSRDGTS